MPCDTRSDKNRPLISFQALHPSEGLKIGNKIQLVAFLEKNIIRVEIWKTGNRKQKTGNRYLKLHTSLL